MGVSGRATGRDYLDPFDTVMNVQDGVGVGLCWGLKERMWDLDWGLFYEEGASDSAWPMWREGQKET